MPELPHQAGHLVHQRGVRQGPGHEEEEVVVEEEVLLPVVVEEEVLLPVALESLEQPCAPSSSFSGWTLHASSIWPLPACLPVPSVRPLSS